MLCVNALAPSRMGGVSGNRADDDVRIYLEEHLSHILESDFFGVRAFLATPKSRAREKCFPSDFENRASQETV